jgi:hypothetical protein
MLSMVEAGILAYNRLSMHIPCKQAADHSCGTALDSHQLPPLGMVQNRDNQLYNLSHAAWRMQHAAAACDLRPAICDTNRGTYV